MLKKSTIEFINKNCNIDLKGKNVLITGANSGIGLKTAETFLFAGANVIMACRNEKKANDARENLLKDYPKAKIFVLSLDLADFKSIDNFVKTMKNQKIDIDCFINNAGVFRQPNQKTKDGFELVMGTNYLGTFYLIGKIMPYLKELKHAVYLINTLSLVYKMVKIDYSDFFCERKYGNFRIYARSKLALAKYTHYLSAFVGDSAKNVRDNCIKVCAVHTGVSVTELMNKAYPRLSKLANLFRFMFNSIEKSSLGSLYIMANNLPNGTFVGPKGWFSMKGYPKINKIHKKMKTDTQKLIDCTKKMLKIN